MSQPQPALPLRALNHISRVCRDVAKVAAFYRDVLGFLEIKRPESFDFEGAWLFNYGIGIHLIAGQVPQRSSKVEPKADHLSFQADSLEEVEGIVRRMGLDYVKQQIDEGGVRVTQLFFHDPEHNMIEICNCDVLPVVPLDSDAEMAEMVCPTCLKDADPLSSVSYTAHHVALDSEPEVSDESFSDSYVSDTIPAHTDQLSLPLLPLMETDKPHTSARKSRSYVVRDMKRPLIINLPEAPTEAESPKPVGAGDSCMDWWAREMRFSTPHTFGLRRSCSMSVLHAGRSASRPVSMPGYSPTAVLMQHQQQ